MTRSLRPGGPAAGFGAGFGLVALFVAYQAISVATSGEVRPAIVIGLFGAFFLRMSFVALTQRVVISPDDLSFKGAFRRTVISRSAIQGSGIRSARGFRGGRPQLVLTLIVDARPRPVSTPFLRYRTDAGLADLEELRARLDHWRATGDLSRLPTG